MYYLHGRRETQHTVAASLLMYKMQGRVVLQGIDHGPYLERLILRVRVPSSKTRLSLPQGFHDRLPTYWEPGGVFRCNMGPSRWLT